MYPGKFRVLFVWDRGMGGGVGYASLIMELYLHFVNQTNKLTRFTICTWFKHNHYEHYNAI